MCTLLCKIYSEVSVWEERQRHSPTLQHEWRIVTYTYSNPRKVAHRRIDSSVPTSKSKWKEDSLWCFNKRYHGMPGDVCHENSSECPLCQRLASKKNCWSVNELKTLIMDNSNIKLLGCLTFSNDRSIIIPDSSLVNHPLQGGVECRLWAWMKRGDDQTFGVTKIIGHCDWQRTCILLCDEWQKILLRRNLFSKITSPLPIWEYTEVRIRRTTIILENTQWVADCFYLHYYHLLVIFNHKIIYKIFR